MKMKAAKLTKGDRFWKHDRWFLVLDTWTARLGPNQNRWTMVKVQLGSIGTWIFRFRPTTVVEII